MNADRENETTFCFFHPRLSAFISGQQLFFFSRGLSGKSFCLQLAFISGQ